jgi:hypothetical protein
MGNSEQMEANRQDAKSAKGEETEGNQLRKLMASLVFSLPWRSWRLGG